MMNGCYGRNSRLICGKNGGYCFWILRFAQNDVMDRQEGFSINDDCGVCNKAATLHLGKMAAFAVFLLGYQIINLHHQLLNPCISDYYSSDNWIYYQSSVNALIVLKLEQLTQNPLFLHYFRMLFFLFHF